MTEAGMAKAGVTRAKIAISLPIVARLRGDHTITSDPRDLRRLDPTCPIIPI